ncbi:MAG: sugar ABC transporter permease [Rhizobium sp.]|uniref:carbohydrate ABC transporter permease n=1 Tax=Rhizobium sp. TaxID=391 RepID=UPI0005680F49
MAQMRKRSRTASYALLPTWFAAIFVYIGTMVWSIRLSFTDSTVFPSSNYVGLAQYARLFRNSRWLASLENVVIFGVLYVIGCLVLGFLLAASLDRKVRFESMFRTIFLYPYAMSFVVTGLIWQWMLNPTLGIQAFVRSLGWTSFVFDWIVSRDMAIYTIVLAGLWQGAGLVMVITLAGMRGISEEQWKAAQIDGIPIWRVYVSIILPQLGPALAAASMLLGMGVIKTYDLVVALTGGGPGAATEVPAKFIMDNLFERQNLGLASAGATVLVLSVLMAVVPFRYAVYIRSRRKGAQR